MAIHTVEATAEGDVHEVGFYASDAEFADLVLPFTHEGLRTGEPVVFAYDDYKTGPAAAMAAGHPRRSATSPTPGRTPHRRRLSVPGASSCRGVSRPALPGCGSLATSPIPDTELLTPVGTATKPRSTGRSATFRSGHRACTTYASLRPKCWTEPGRFITTSATGTAPAGPTTATTSPWDSRTSCRHRRIPWSRPCRGSS